MYECDFVGLGGGVNAALQKQQMSVKEFAISNQDWI